MSRRCLVDDLSQKVFEAGHDLGIRGKIGVQNVAVQARQLGCWMRERKETMTRKEAVGRVISRGKSRERGARGPSGSKVCHL